ncbi:Translational repressor [Malassezia yamatoensis]|uniref:Translational repressor n=1 Tax=Malassezia yamatoensis TaxID=253288 RepID=A0AAJ6CIU4_9BASI|nr:Translational repressor [Malassezia yamatoensis]
MAHAPHSDANALAHNTERANWIASSQEQLLQAQLQQLGLDSHDASMDPSQDSFLPYTDSPRTWEATDWTSPNWSGSSPWGPPLTSVPSHRRGASDLAGFRFPSSQRMPPLEMSGTGSGGVPPVINASSSMEQQRVAIQHQIEDLQRQQQILVQQQQRLSTQPSSQDNTTTTNHTVSPPSRSAHRRIQSQSATTPASLRSPPMLHPLDQQHPRWPTQSAMAPPPTSSNAMRSNPQFSFPPRRISSETPTNAPASHFPLHANDALPHRKPSHTRHASHQLSSELSPEYLIAAGGMLSGSSLAIPSMSSLVGDLADGFWDASSSQRRGPHARSTSMSSASSAIAQHISHTETPMDLAQAQAQLAALHRSRQQAGPGTHSRSASYSGQRAASYSHGNSQPRKALFGSYLPRSCLAPLLLTGKLVVGILRVNKRNRSDAWVSTEVLEQDIFISGSKDRNRALEGDLVAVELLDPLEVWQTKRDKVDKKKRKEEHTSSMHFDKNPIQRRSEKARDDTEVEGAHLKLVEEEEESDAAPPALAGHIVAIVEREAGQLFAGTLALLRPSSVASKEKQQQNHHPHHDRTASTNDDRDLSNTRPKIVWFRPSDKRVPLIAIPSDQAPKDFWDENRQAEYQHTLFVACIKRWPITSLHPFGTLVDQLGSIGDLHAEAQAVIQTHCHALLADFSEAAIKQLPASNWSVPSTEYQRHNYGPTQGSSPNKSAFVWSVSEDESSMNPTIAYSLQDIAEDRVEIGVHIADLAYFLPSNTPLDRDARRRAHSANLINHTYPMLPTSLLQQFASFQCNTDRLAISFVFQVSRDLQLQHIAVHRSVIHVTSNFSAKEFLSESRTPNQLPSSWKVAQGWIDQLTAQRIEQGALILDEPQWHFQFDSQGHPQSARTSSSSLLNCGSSALQPLVIEANKVAAYRIADALHDTALLCRVEKPSEKNLQWLWHQFQEFRLDSLKVPSLTTDNLVEVMNSLPADAKPVGNALLAKILKPARYFCSGMVDISKYAHFSLPSALYTRCDAPASCYAQLSVQRQLIAIVHRDSLDFDAENIARIAQQANVRQKALALAQEQCAHLYLCHCLVHHGAQQHLATVMSITDMYMDLFVGSLNIEKRLHFDQLHAQVDRSALPTLKLTWHSSKVTQQIQPLSQFPVMVQATMDKSPAVLSVAMLPPS